MAPVCVVKYQARGKVPIPTLSIPGGQITTKKSIRDLNIYKSFIFLKDLSRFVEIYHDFSQDVFRFRLTHTEFIQVPFSFTESLLEHSYQIALIYQYGQVTDEKPLYM